MRSFMMQLNDTLTQYTINNKVYVTIDSYFNTLLSMGVALLHLK